jgi:hypothetical protein
MASEQSRWSPSENARLSIEKGTAEHPAQLERIEADRRAYSRTSSVVTESGWSAERLDVPPTDIPAASKRANIVCD